MSQATPANGEAASPPISRLAALLSPRRAAVAITDPADIRAGFAYYQPRILLWTTIGYGIFYFVRKNLSVAMPLMGQQLGIQKSDLGLMLTLHGILYGVSKFANGILADRADARLFMGLSLLASAALNVGFGLSSTVMVLSAFWIANGWVQGMGYPPCARLLTHWFSPRELATRMSWWNASHTLGGCGILLLCGALVARQSNWRLCFFVPAAIAALVAVLLLFFLRDAPESLGLPEVEGTATGDTTGPATGAFLVERVFSNPYIWVISLGNFFVYAVRLALLDWGPTLLSERKGVHVASGAWMVAGFEVAGLAGMLLTGWMTDRFFRGRTMPLCVACMLLCALSLFVFWKVPGRHVVLDAALLCAVGFFIYGPQALVAVAVSNLATKRAAATAVGLTSIFGYASTVASGWGLGTLVQRSGWDAGFMFLIATAIAGAVVFATALPSKTHGYASES